MANIPIWPGSSSFTPGADTPFGFYDADSDFQLDADKVSNFCARRLGYPLVDIELQDISFYAAFEESVTTYGNELYAYKIRDNQLTFEGLSTGSNLNTSIVTPSFEPIVRLSEQYGAEGGTGGNITYYSGSIPLTASVQEYDLKQWAVDEGITGSIEIKRVFYENSPAIDKIYDPYLANGLNLMSSFGFGGMSPGLGGFMMMPNNFTIAMVQAIEISEQVRRSNFSFEMRNNKLKLFPIPTSGSHNMWFEYIKVNDRTSGSVDPSCGQVTNASNMPYTNPNYDLINSIGRQWIFEYTLALVKEILGYVRGKYSTIPIPNADLTLNQADLLAAATAEKTALLERLRAYFDEMSRASLLERRASEKESRDKELEGVPTFIYIG